MMEKPFDGLVGYGHNGGIDGFQSHLSYLPQKDIAIAITSNGLNYSMNEFRTGALHITLDKPFEIPSLEDTSISLIVKQMQKYVGTYSSKQVGMDIKVFVNDSTLLAQATGQSAFPLTATSDTTMRFDRAGIVMKFDSLKSQKFRQFTLEQAGNSTIFKRK